MVSGGVLSDPTTFSKQLELHNNTIYAPQGRVSITLSGETVDFAAFQKAGFDASSRVSGEMPSAAQIVAWGEALLA